MNKEYLDWSGSLPTKVKANMAQSEREIKKVEVGDCAQVAATTHALQDSMLEEKVGGSTTTRRRKSSGLSTGARLERINTSERRRQSRTMQTEPSLATVSRAVPVQALVEMPRRQEKEAGEDAIHHMQLMDPGGPETAACFLRASDLPPITPESLAELDMPRIINNPKLRHDVNFDRELHFRPNLDGSKGRQKVRQADEYWKALEGELYMYSLVQARRRDPQQGHKEAYWQAILAQSRRRLPKIFQAIRDILKTLVPDYDQKAIMERLDVDLLMQQIQNGVCDLIDLADWLAKVLKNHCAPMRDELVDAMQKEIRRGATEQSSTRLVNGLRQLLNILEAMKLDVANHQIRHMRPLLIEDTINFQRRYNEHRIQLGKIDVPRSRLWLDNEVSHMTTDTYTPSHLDALTSALLKSLVFDGIGSLYPQTFYLDADRLRSMRIDLHSIIYQEICRDLLIELASPHTPPSELVNATAALHMTISAIVGLSGKFVERLGNIAAEIMRILCMLDGRDPPSDVDLLDLVEHRLEMDLHAGSPTFTKYAGDLYDRLFPKLQASVHAHAKHSALQLQDLLANALAPAYHPIGSMGAVLLPPTTSHAEPPAADPDADLLRRFTHLLVLHWHVWADLVYLAPPSSSSSDDSDSDAASLSSSSGDGVGCGSPPPSAAPSPTMPVAQAVYAPGGKFLPIGVKVTEVPNGLPTPAASPAPEEEACAEHVGEDEEDEIVERAGQRSLDRHESSRDDDAMP